MMPRTSILTTPFIATWLVLLPPSTVLAAPDCVHWIERDGIGRAAVEAFWKTAGPDEVARCLRAGADVEVRGDAGRTEQAKLATLNPGVAFARTPVHFASGGGTPLHWAAAVGRADTVTALLKAGAAPEARDVDDRTPLHWAAANFRADTVTALLKAGADPEARDWDSVTPLHEAAENNNGGAVVALLKAGADPEARIRTTYFNRTPLHQVAQYGREGKEGVKTTDTMDMITALLKSGADLEARGDKSGGTPLHVAALTNPYTVTALLKFGAVLEAQDKFGRTPLHWAASFGRAGTLTALLKAGAALEARDKSGRTPLHEAAEISGSSVTALLKAGAAPDARDKSGRTPLHEAAAQINQASGQVTALLKAGADPEARTKRGERPIDLADIESIPICDACKAYGIGGSPYIIGRAYQEYWNLEDASQ